MSHSDFAVNGLVEQLIEDICSLWRFWSQDDAAKVDPAITAYLLANRHIIEDILHVVYEQHATDERKQLLTQDPALDKIGIPYAFYEIASGAIRDLPDRLQDDPGRLCEEDFTMLLRALEFARGFDTNRVQGPLQNSPARAYLTHRPRKSP